jgi:hypothetical protein
MNNHCYIVAGCLPGYATNKKRGYDTAKVGDDLPIEDCRTQFEFFGLLSLLGETCFRASSNSATRDVIK